jgi:hypothetical protein
MNGEELKDLGRGPVATINARYIGAIRLAEARGLSSLHLEMSVNPLKPMKESTDVQELLMQRMRSEGIEVETADDEMQMRDTVRFTEMRKAVRDYGYRNQIGKEKWESHLAWIKEEFPWMMEEVR